MSIYLSLSSYLMHKKKKGKKKKKKNEPPVAFPPFHREHTCTLSTNIY